MHNLNIVTTSGKTYEFSTSYGDFMSKSINEFLEEQKNKDGEGKVTLTTDQIIELQNRVRHYLNSYEVENKLNSSEMARILGYTPMHYSRFKLVGTVNKVASCLLFFSNFANLRKMSLSEFMMNIENKPLKNENGKLTRDMWDWEVDTLQVLSKVESTIRRYFTRKTLKDSEFNEITFCKFEICLTILVLMSQFRINDFKLATTLIKEIANRKHDFAKEKDEENISELQVLRKELIRLMKNKNSVESES